MPGRPRGAPPLPWTIFGPDLGPWKYDHRELAPGVQTTLPFKGARQDAFVYTLQTIYARPGNEDPNVEPDKQPHYELATGVQFGAPLNAILGDGSVWTFNPFVRITDVDRLGAGHRYHLWQPYAQIGVSASTGSDINPTITVSLFPVNLSLDATDFLTLNLAGGGTFGFNLNTGAASLGAQVTFGVNLKFGAPEPASK